jgi:hypothetical protein
MQVNFNILNQKGAPAVYEDSLANRPAASFQGRLFVDTDAPTSTGIYRDTGTSWQLIAAPGSTPPPVTNIYNSNGFLTDSRIVDLNFESLEFNTSNSIGTSGSFKFYAGGSVGKFNHIHIFSGNQFFTGWRTAGTLFFEISGFSNTAPQGIFLNYSNFQHRYGFTNTNITITDQSFLTEHSIQLKSQNSFGNESILKLNFTNLITLYQSVNNGINLNFATRFYQFGQINGNNNTGLFINDATQQIYTKNGANFWGLYFDFVNNDYRIGRLSGNGSLMFLTPNVATMNLGNGTTTQAQCGLTASQCNFGFIPALGGELRFIGSNFSITGITSYTINGTGITSGTAGGSSGQHLNITINGTPYKIKLENP